MLIIDGYMIHMHDIVGFIMLFQTEVCELETVMVDLTQNEEFGLNNLNLYKFMA